MAMITVTVLATSMEMETVSLLFNELTVTARTHLLSAAHECSIALVQCAFAVGAEMCPTTQFDYMQVPTTLVTRMATPMATIILGIKMATATAVPTLAAGMET